jgi:hypothetical protein
MTQRITEHAYEQVQFPNQFQGLFQRVEPRFARMMVDARRAMASLPVHPDFQAYYDYILANPQPSFILAPLMFLATAEESGGVKRVHEGYLPVIMLLMETFAVIDDTIDRSLMRSGRTSFPGHFGEKAVPMFVSWMTASALRLAYEVGDQLPAATIRLFTELMALELWETEYLYPAPDRFQEWVDRRYRANHAVVSFCLNSALELNGRRPLAEQVTMALSIVSQDVDDLVNLLENREQDGENDDLKMGIITRPTLETVQQLPGFLHTIEALWAEYRTLRPLSTRELHAALPALNARTGDLYAQARDTIIRHGIPITLRKSYITARECVRATPPELRPLIRDLTLSFLDRLRRCPPPTLGKS